MFNYFLIFIFEGGWVRSCNFDDDWQRAVRTGCNARQRCAGTEDYLCKTPKHWAREDSYLILWNRRRPEARLSRRPVHWSKRGDIRLTEPKRSAILILSVIFVLASRLGQQDHHWSKREEIRWKAVRSWYSAWCLSWLPDSVNGITIGRKVERFDGQQCDLDTLPDFRPRLTPAPCLPESPHAQ